VRELTRAIAIAIATSMSGCSSVQPEVGERLEACVDADSDASKIVDFKTQIRPIIEARCSSCHYYGTGTEEGYREVHFDQGSLGTLRKGGVNTATNILVRGKPCSSAYVQKIRGTFSTGARMPKNAAPLSREEIQLIMDWIAEGAAGNDAD
jgi:uncharacterized membrane protein